MKQRVYCSTAVGVLLAALSLCGTGTAGESVPFKGESSGFVTTVGFDPVEGVVYVHGTGTGNATHLGRFTATADVKIYTVAGFIMGTWTYTAANGDKLFLTGVGTGVDPTHGSGNFTIVGGTGRFEGASGTLQQSITFGTPPGPPVIPYSEVLEGTISLAH
jgi:hypothetical protein